MAPDLLHQLLGADTAGDGFVHRCKYFLKSGFARVLQREHIGTDKAAFAGDGVDDALTLQFLIGFGYRIGIDAHLPSQCAHRGKLLVLIQNPEQRQADDLFLQLFIERYPALQV